MAHHVGEIRLRGWKRTFGVMNIAHDQLRRHADDLLSILDDECFDHYSGASAQQGQEM